MFQQGDLVLGGRYRIDDLAGEKKSCIVFKATCVSDGKLAALRVLAPFVLRQPHVVSRLRSRAEFAMGMEHPNLTQVHEVGEEGGSFAIVESWHEALPLLRVVRGKGACSPYETAWIASQLARGIDHLISCGAPGFDFTLSDVYADIGDLRQETEFFSMPVHQWPGLAVRLSPLALDGDGFSERALATPTDSAQPLVRSVARIIFNLVTGGMGDPLSEPVLSEKFTASLRDCLTGARQTGTCRELLWTLFGDFGPEISALLPGTSEAKAPEDGEVGALLEDLDRQGEELEALLRYKSFGKQIKKQLAVLEEQRAGVMEQQRRMRDDGERLQALEERLRSERDQLAGQRDELSRRGSELAEKERVADEAARARAAELREREVELETLHAEQERERSQVRAELERLRVSQEGLAHEKSALSERVARYESEQQELAASRESLEAGRRKLDAERAEIEGRVGEFKRLKSELERSEQDLEEKRRALAQRQTEIETKGVGLSSVERELSERLAAEQKELEGRIVAVQEKNRALEDREEALRAKEASLLSANQALVREEETLSGRLGEVDSKLALEKGRLTDKEREIQSREEILAAKEREWQAKLERQRSIQDEKESLVEELRGRLAGVSGELQAVTAEKQRLEAEQSRIAASQEALGERSVSIDRERLDLKAFEEKLRKELHQESEDRSRENKLLERRIVLYRRIVRFGVPLAAAVIAGLALLLLAKPKFPGSAAEVRNMPEWKQEWLRRELAKDIGEHVTAGEWRESLGALHSYALGFSRRPEEVMDAARKTCGELAKEFDAAPEKFAPIFSDHEGHELPVAAALGELASWGIPDAGRVRLHLDARESLRQAQEEHSLRARADALKAVVELKRFYPGPAAWLAAVGPVLKPLVATSITEAMALLEPGKSGKEISREFFQAFSGDQVLKDLKELEDAGIKEAAALRVAAEGLGKLTASGDTDPPALAIFLADRLADGWPVEIRTKLVAVLMKYVGVFRAQLKKGEGTFVEVLESTAKPPELARVAEILWNHLNGGNATGESNGYSTDWFSEGQRGEIFGFIGNALTRHHEDGAVLHAAYGIAANLRDKEGLYWVGTGVLARSMEDRMEGEGPRKRIVSPDDYQDGTTKLMTAAASDDSGIRQESLLILAKASLDLGDVEAGLKRARQAFEARAGMKSAELYFEALDANLDDHENAALAEEIAALFLKAAGMTRESASDPRAMDVLDAGFKVLFASLAAGAEPAPVLLEELKRQFEIPSSEAPFAGLRFAWRANWKHGGYPPFGKRGDRESLIVFLQDLWEAARAGHQVAQDVATANGLNWNLDKDAAVEASMKFLGK